MRYTLRSILMLAILVSAIGCGDENAARPAQASPKGIEFHRKAAGELGADGWYEATSTRGGFSVRLPGPFNDFTQTGLSSNGGKIVIHGIGRSTPGGVKYSAALMISVDDKGLPKSQAGDSFARDGTLKARREVVCEGVRGIEIHVQEPKSAAKMRGYDVDNKRYTLIAEYPSDANADVLAQVDKFLNSLKGLK